MYSRAGPGSAPSAEATSLTKERVAGYPIGAPSDGLRNGVPNLSPSMAAVLRQSSGRTITFSEADPIERTSSSDGRHPGIETTSTPISDIRWRSSSAPVSHPGS